MQLAKALLAWQASGSQPDNSLRHILEGLHWRLRRRVKTASISGLAKLQDLLIVRSAGNAWSSACASHFCMALTDYIPQLRRRNREGRVFEVCHGDPPGPTVACCYPNAKARECNQRDNPPTSQCMVDDLHAPRKARQASQILLQRLLDCMTSAVKKGILVFEHAHFEVLVVPVFRGCPHRVYLTVEMLQISAIHGLVELQ
mmetsp:Transcript_55381/g.140032  ORF Transcript_55381/g.140032 Transcript_55381/m.140032 type:complete len:201 (-) Transcript_55381:608-1210(-)